MSATPFHPGHLVMVDIPGTSLDAASAEFLRRHHVRAICLFRRNLGTEDEIRQLTADLREVMGPNSLIGIDQEGGSTIRATFLPQAPAAMALGAIGDEALCEEVGATVARGLRSLGINWNFAPVLDVNNNPGNPVIAERSFGEDPAEVARLAAAWMRGSLREGVACCVKHFPGHGDTATDSHHALPVVDKSVAELEALELKPFRALAHARGDTPAAPSVMTAHIVYPQIDREHPATLSRPVLTGLLREAIGYDGVVITDALMMKAVHERYGHAVAAVMALQAGADMPLAQGTLEEQGATVKAIEQALAEGHLLPERLDVGMPLPRQVRQGQLRRQEAGRLGRGGDDLQHRRPLERDVDFIPCCHDSIAALLHSLHLRRSCGQPFSGTACARSRSISASLAAPARSHCARSRSRLSFICVMFWSCSMSMCDRVSRVVSSRSASSARSSLASSFA